MAITHNWKITKLIQLNNETGTICKVQYMLKSIDGDLVAENGGNIELETENVENFVPYSQLDEQTIIGWVKSKLAEKSRNPENENEVWIESVKNPPIPETIMETLPWNQSQESVV